MIDVSYGAQFTRLEGVQMQLLDNIAERDLLRDLDRGINNENSSYKI